MYRELTIGTRTAIESALKAADAPRRSNCERLIVVTMKHELRGWGDMISIQLDPDAATVEASTNIGGCWWPLENNEIDRVIYYFIGEDGMWDIDNLKVINLN